MMCFLFFFFFKQKTAYDMRISDWSSDVCSSDLGLVTLRRDGEPIINVTNINTVNGSHITIDRVRYQAPNVEFDYDHELWYDDVRVNLDTIDYIREGRYALLPYASDDQVAWTPSTVGDNYSMFVEWTCDQDSTYNKSTV